MAKPRVHPTKTCANCGLEYQSSSNRQIRCLPCRPERDRQAQQRQRLFRGDVLRARNAAFRAAHREELAERRKAKRKTVKALGSSFVPPRGGMNAEELLAYHREYKRAWRAKNRLRVRMSNAIRRGLVKKEQCRHWLEALGYTIDDLRAHLERQFLKGMTWDNIADWQIDHIVPHRLFNYSSVTDPDFLACWALTNLRPLWAEENRRKWGERTHLI